MNNPIPATIDEYLVQVKRALAGADPAMMQDALYDAEEHLRSELAENPGVPEAEVIAKVASSYGAPEEVAAIYRDTEIKVTRALRAPSAPKRASRAGRFFGVAADPRAWAALFYLLLALPTGVLYFTVAVTGTSLSLGLSILIIGLPFIVLFLGLVRVLSLVEGRIVEVLLGERMPRRPLYTDRALPWMERIKAMFTDARTWSTLLYMVLKLPLGILYFVVAVTGLALSIALIVSPVLALLLEEGRSGIWIDGTQVIPSGLALPIAFLLGVVLLFAFLHLFRALGRLHGQMAKHFLVKAAAV
jgi:uncharacterized membrane protein